MSYAIRLEHVCLGWGNNKLILKDINGEFAKGSLTAIVGPNGAGKSTLVKGLVSMLRPNSGRILLAPDIKNQLSFLPQANDLDPQFPITTFDLVAMGAWHRTGMWKSYSRQDRQQVMQSLEQVGLQAQADDLIGTLSGGQLQRALFARLIMCDAQLMILDEPFAAIDKHTQTDLMAMIHQWHQQGRTVIVVLHDVDLVRSEFSQAMLLAKSVVAWGDVQDVLVEANLHQARRLCLGIF